MNVKVSAVIVTHNSERCLSHCYSALTNQTLRVENIVIVDSGSQDKSYLDAYRIKENCLIKEVDNIGYGAANNIGLSLIVNQSDFIVILNPDTFLESNFIQKALEIAAAKPECAIFTGTLSGFNLENNSETGLIDSTGIFRKWYGRWYDRDQGRGSENFDYPVASYVPAICGALMFCRSQVIKDKVPNFFDEYFFLYKEDIELSLRIRKEGWKLYYSPELLAYHCRGWGEQRQEIERNLRIVSSRNEIEMYKKHPSPYIVWAVAKYILVKWFNI